MATGSALGAKIEYAEFVDADTEVTYEELMHCGDWELPFGVAAELDLTVHASAQKKRAAGIVDPGSVSVPLIWDDDDDSHQWVETELHAKHQFRFTTKDSLTPVVKLGILKSLTAKNPVGTGAKERVLVIRLSGGATAAEATP